MERVIGNNNRSRVANSWYDFIKIADITTFEERNVLNSRIHRLEKIAEMLEYAAKLVYQTQRGAKGLIGQLMADKRLSSFPDVGEMLNKTYDAALDSPVRFSIGCKSSADLIKRKVAKLKKERKDFVEKTLSGKKLF